MSNTDHSPLRDLPAKFREVLGDYHSLYGMKIRRQTDYGDRLMAYRKKLEGAIDELEAAMPLASKLANNLERMITRDVHTNLNGFHSDDCWKCEAKEALAAWRDGEPVETVLILCSVARSHEDESCVGDRHGNCRIHGGIMPATTPEEATDD